jgi:RNA polymerase sigma-70 factor (ECF subfamily)
MEVAASIVQPNDRGPAKEGTNPAGPTPEKGETMTTTRIAIAEGIKAAPAIPAGRTAARTPAAADPAERRRAATDTAPLDGHLGEFSDLYNQYFPKVFAYVYGRVQDREISLDIVSDVFEKAYVKKRSLRSLEAFGSWLFTIARNEVSSHWRKEKPAMKAAQDAAWENELHNQPRGPEESLLHRERLDSLSALVRRLPRREQEIIALKFDAELTNREIASVLSTSEVNVRVTIFRALRKLRERMQAPGAARP